MKKNGYEEIPHFEGSFIDASGVLMAGPEIGSHVRVHFDPTAPVHAAEGLTGTVLGKAFNGRIEDTTTPFRAVKLDQPIDYPGIGPMEVVIANYTYFDLL